MVRSMLEIRKYQNWLQATRGLSFDNYDALWRWSVTDLDAFWQSIWDYFEMQSPTAHTAVLGKRSMPGAEWFPGAQGNYAQQVFRHAAAAEAAGVPALISHGETSLANGEAPRELGWAEMRRQSASLALHLKAQGVQPGDRVAVYLPNTPETMVAFLAVVSIGAVWSVCAPDMGTPAVLDRFAQIKPKVLIACNGVRYGGKDIDRREAVAELVAALPSVTHVITHKLLDAIDSIADSADYTLATARNDAETATFEPLWLPFDHPLWIVYSSGTTGLPKPIVHGHGGVALVGLALLRLHNDLAPSYAGPANPERFHWYSSTGWIMWNVQAASLLNGTTCCIYDGNPAGSSKDAPDWTTLWRFVTNTRATFFGAGAAFFANCMKAGVDVAQCGDLSRLRTLGTTGSPLSEDTQRWGTAQFARIGNPDVRRAGPPQASTAPSGGSALHEVKSVGAPVWWCNISGGTDFAGAFIGGNRELPVVPGEMQCRILGCAVEAWNDKGESVVDEVGELVCTQPLPSMPLYFVGDEGNQRYLASYFDTYPGVWRHGDWLKVTLDDAMKARLNQAVKTALSPRFVPNEIFAVPEIPRTLSGKKQELPIKKLLLGQPLEKVVNRDAMANPASLDWYVAFAQKRQAHA
jgi:acetoacetyl-CoA synthetase